MLHEKNKFLFIEDYQFNCTRHSIVGGTVRIVDLGYKRIMTTFPYKGKPYTVDLPNTPK